MADTQPVVVEVSCLDDSSNEPLHNESVVDGTTDETDVVNDDCVEGSLVEDNGVIHVDAETEQNEAVLQVTNCTSVVAGKMLIPWIFSSSKFHRVIGILQDAEICGPFYVAVFVNFIVIIFCVVVICLVCLCVRSAVVLTTKGLLFKAGLIS